MKILKSYVKQVSGSTKLTIALVAIAVILVSVIVCVIINKVDDTGIQATTVSTDKNTRSIIEEMREIGQWEFLTINDEELVDTTRRGFFSDSQLVRIYYGTLRLGIDFSMCNADWISERNDTIMVRLPEIQLLDSLFIDETRSQSFYEQGRWTNNDRKKLYEKAHRQMLARCFTKANRQQARKNAEEQLGVFFKQIAINEHSTVVFE